MRAITTYVAHIITQAWTHTFTFFGTSAFLLCVHISCTLLLMYVTIITCGYVNYFLKSTPITARCVTKYCACIFCDKHAIKISNRFLMVYQICIGVFSIISNVHSQFIKSFENNRNHLKYIHIFTGFSISTRAKVSSRQDVTVYSKRVLLI